MPHEVNIYQFTHITTVIAHDLPEAERAAQERLQDIDPDVVSVKTDRTLLCTCNKDSTAVGLQPPLEKV